MPDGPDGPKEPTARELEERLRALLGDGEELSADRLVELEEQLRAIEGELDEASRKRRSEDERAEEDLHARIESIRERARAAQGEHRERQKTRAEALREQGENARGLGIGLSIGYAILGLPLLGYGAGWLIDQRMGTNLAGGIGMLVGATLAVGYAVVVLNRTAS